LDSFSSTSQHMQNVWLYHMHAKKCAVENHYVAIGLHHPFEKALEYPDQSLEYRSDSLFVFCVMGRTQANTQTRTFAITPQHGYKDYPRQLLRYKRPSIESVLPQQHSSPSFFTSSKHGFRLFHPLCCSRCIRSR